jgi:NAD(P)-dependent dehydrogenase (short-subunit alcohol dehydrogenase family)
MPTVLVVGATRGLGASLVAQYAARPGTTVLATTRSSAPPSDAAVKPTRWITGIDISQPAASGLLAAAVAPSAPVDTVIINAGFFGKETFDEPDWDAQVRMYATSAVGPVFVVQALVKAGAVRAGGKFVLVTSEAGSLGLRHDKEGGGMYGHHASKAAENMAGRLLSLDLKDKGIAVVMVHVSFLVK